MCVVCEKSMIVAQVTLSRSTLKIGRQLQVLRLFSSLFLSHWFVIAVGVMSIYFKKVKQRNGARLFCCLISSNLSALFGALYLREFVSQISFRDLLVLNCL